MLHDIGNPPFGHAGEEAIQWFFEQNFKTETKHKCSVNDTFEHSFGSLTLNCEELLDFLFFDGNANGFRIINRLAGKYPESETDTQKTGFHLSAVTQAAMIKYPFRVKGHPDPDKANKFGYFKCEKALFGLIEKTLQLKSGKRHPLVYLVEAADDICYLVMDLEDAIKSGFCKVDTLWRELKIDTLIAGKENDEEIQRIIAAKRQLESLDTNKPIKRIELKALETIRSGAIRVLIDKCFKGKSEEQPPKGFLPPNSVFVSPSFLAL